MVEQKQTYSKWFYVAIAAGACGILTGAYYLYNLFKGDIELSENDMIEIDEIKKQIEHKPNDQTTEVQQTEAVDSDGNGQLNVETALKILALINRKTEEHMKTVKPDVEERRRNAYLRKDDAEYEQICAEILEERNKSYLTISEKILGEFNYKYEDLGKCIQSLPPIEIEKRMLAYDKPVFENGKPPKDKVKDFFKFYGKMCVDQMKHFQGMMNNAASDPYQQEFVMYQLMILKFKIDDELYQKCQIAENQLRYLLFEYNLYEDPEIKALVMNMSRYDEMLSGGFA